MSEKTVRLNSGYDMPLIGLGCWQPTSEELAAAVECALDEGYRHIDSAYSYQNEDGVGMGIHNWLKKTNKKREEIFVVTKLPEIGMHKGGAERFLKMSLDAMKLDYVDLYLIHSPMGMEYRDDKNVWPMTEDGKDALDVSTDLIAVWKEMEGVVDKGLAKSIGVSNFSIKQITKVSANARIKPAVHQLELHARYQQLPMQEFCKSRNIVITGFAPLGSPGTPPKIQNPKFKDSRLLDDPVVTLVAERHQVTNAQVLLRYLVQQKIVAIPKSINPKRIKANYDVWSFNLSDVEMAALKTLDLGGPEGSVESLETRIMDHPESPY